MESSTIGSPSSQKKSGVRPPSPAEHTKDNHSSPRRRRKSGNRPPTPLLNGASSAAHQRYNVHKPGEEVTDRFIQETSPGYRGCRIKNVQEAKSLDRQNKELEVASKLASSKIQVEQKELKDQLRLLRLEKEKNNYMKWAEQVSQPGLMSATRGRSESCRDTPVEEQYPDLEYEAKDFVNPYPVFFSRTNSNSDLFEAEGRSYTRRRGKRQSLEFEDLEVNSSTGSLLPPMPKPALLPSTPLTKLRPLSRQARSYNSFKMAEAENWAGTPEAISSVRRAKKSVEQQQRDFALSRLNFELLEGLKGQQRMDESGLSKRSISESGLRRSNSFGSRPVSRVGRSRKPSDNSSPDESPLPTRKETKRSNSLKSKKKSINT